MYHVSTQVINEHLINVHYYYYCVTVFVQGQLLSLLGNHSGAHQAEVHQPAGKSHCGYECLELVVCHWGIIAWVWCCDVNLWSCCSAWEMRIVI